MTKKANEALIIVGRVTSVFGIQGWVNVYSYTEPAKNILEFPHWYLRPVNAAKPENEYLDSSYRRVHLSDGKTHGKKIIAQLAECSSRDDARQFVQQDIFVKRLDFPDLEEGFYWSDLEGLEVFDVGSSKTMEDESGSRKSLGRVESLVATGANDVLVVDPGSAHKGQNKNELMIPFVREHYILEVNIEEGFILVDWPDDFND